MSEKAEDQAKQDEAKTTRGRQPKQEDQAKQDHLIAMIKDGATIKVHPSCVADHKRLGWAEA